jgi:hypothetical protein
MSEHDQVTETVNEAPQGVSEAPQNTPEEQAAIDRYRESQKTAEERDAGVPEGYNEDGTKQEELIAGKFKSQEDLLKAYEELQKKMGQPQETPEEAPEAKEESIEEADADSTEFSATKYEQEVASNGSLSDASYAELESKGFTRSQVDTYIKGQQAYADSVRNSVYESVGGEEAYSSLIQWASQNMEPAAIKEYNDAVDSMDQSRMLRSLEYMNLKHGQSAPREARRLEGDSPAGGLQPYSNKNEWQRDSTSRLYGKDAKFTKMVDQRYLAARRKGIL